MKEHIIYNLACIVGGSVRGTLLLLPKILSVIILKGECYYSQPINEELETQHGLIKLLITEIISGGYKFKPKSVVFCINFQCCVTNYYKFSGLKQ